VIVTVLIKCNGGILRVIVVTKEVVVALGNELADTVRIGLKDLNVTAGQRKSSRMILECNVTIESKDRSALCKTITLNAEESHILEELQDLRIYRSTA
jgi:hypothetical protein